MGAWGAGGGAVPEAGRLGRPELWGASSLPVALSCGFSGPRPGGLSPWASYRPIGSFR